MSTDNATDHKTEPDFPPPGKPVTALMRPGLNGLKVPKEWEGDDCEGEFITTLDAQSEDGRRQLMSALNSEIPSLDVIINTDITVSGITIHPALKLDDVTGEAARLVRIVLHCVGGKSYQCFSSGVMKSLRILHSVMGDDVFREPRVCTVKRVGTNNTRSFYRLDWRI
jgi:hypothetical protein